MSAFIVFLLLFVIFFDLRSKIERDDDRKNGQELVSRHTAHACQERENYGQDQGYETFDGQEVSDPLEDFFH